MLKSKRDNHYTNFKNAFFSLLNVFFNTLITLHNLMSKGAIVFDIFIPCPLPIVDLSPDTDFDNHNM